MPVGAYAGANVSNGNGVTTLFPYNFKILDQTHIEVKVDGVVKALGADYAVTGVGLSNGGNVLFIVPPANGAVVQRARKVPYTRTQDYQNNGDFQENTVDSDFDLAEMQIQQIAADVARAFKAPLSVTADQVIADAAWALRQGRYLGFDAGGALALFDTATTGVPADTLIRVVATIAALKALIAPSAQVSYLVLGNAAAGDGGGGGYYWDAASSETDDSATLATIIAPNAGGVGRWKLRWDRNQILASSSDRRPAHPSYVECMAAAGYHIGTPTGIANYPDGFVTEAGFLYTLNVTGALGATSLLVNAGLIADAGLATRWGAVITHDDGTYGFYQVIGTDGVNHVNITPPLAKAVTAKSLYNRHSTVLGQHYTQYGYFALAQHIYNTLRPYVTRELWIAQMRETDTDGGWQMIGGLTNGGFLADGITTKGIGYNSLRNAVTNNVACAIGTRSFEIGADTNGQGVEWTVDLKGRRGYLETFIGCEPGGPTTVEFLLDGTVVSTQTVENAVERVVFPFSNAAKGTLRVKIGVNLSTRIRVGRTTWWTGQRETGKQLFDPLAKIVMLGDSWFTYYNVAVQAELSRLIKADTGRTAQIVNSSVAGKTSLWGKTNFQTLVLDKDPDYVVIEFFVNDQNGVDGVTQQTWLENLRWMMDTAIENGITPLVVMPACTASEAQSQTHGTWSNALANGGPIDNELANLNSTAVGSVGAGETNLMTYPIAADELAVKGRGTYIKAWGTGANNANAKTLKVYFGATVVLTQALTAAQADRWMVEVEILKTGPSTQDYFVRFFQDGAAQINNIAIGTAVEVDTAAITAKCTGTGVANNDIVQEGMIVTRRHLN